MKNIHTILCITAILSISACFHIKDFDSKSTPISHIAFDSLLRRYVDTEGGVNYEGFIRDSITFRAYLKLLSNNHPNNKNWQPNEQKAYWINAYNAFTIQLICDHYPISSIKDVQHGIPFVSDTWQINFINIEGNTYNLNNIEHGILRAKYSDPRIHAALNCASRSCPKLMNEAFVAEKLESQLDTVMHRFINDGVRNHIKSAHNIELSKLFSWYAQDFKKNTPSVIAFINKFSTIKIDDNAIVKYLDYDWLLNKQ